MIHKVFALLEALARQLAAHLLVDDAIYRFSQELSEGGNGAKNSWHEEVVFFVLEGLNELPREKRTRSLGS